MQTKIESSIKAANSSTSFDLASNKHRLNNTKDNDTYNLINIYRHGFGLTHSSAGQGMNHGQMVMEPAKKKPAPRKPKVKVAIS